ncbi:MAG: ribulose-phosphate 3-epimerase [Chitinispirillaceae bacterium]|nr:ribulose-phosphate 3-epimerase [Chitinispirillaceae bacterium]
MASTLFKEIKKITPLLSVGIMSADLMRLDESVKTLAACGAKLLHFDVMDGRFCPQLTAGPFFVKGIRTTLLKDVHLLVEDPLPLIPEFAAAGADIITVHVESGLHARRALQLVAEQKNANDPDRGILRGLALNPGTPLEAAGPLLDEADIVFLVAVEPGFTKQRFAESTRGRLERLKEMNATRQERLLFGIDGGVTRDNIGAVGADIVVTGSAVFEGGRIQENFDFMMQNIKK